MPSLPVLVVGTLDTKGKEIDFLASHIRRCGVSCIIVDVSVKGSTSTVADISRDAVAACHPDGAEAVLGQNDRGDAVSAMSVALCAYVASTLGTFSAIVGVGGSGGTSLITPAMQALPVGLPKLMVSTMCAGNVEPYVGCSDITLMPSVADIAGLNQISTAVLANAAAAIAGMAQWRVPSLTSSLRPALGMTMFGVTTPCCDAVRSALEDEFDVLTFHATGSGGKAMEKLVSSGMLGGVIDLTTTEIADEIVGGVLSAGPARLDAIAASNLPAVVSLGACDMVNFGARETVPDEFAQRRLHVHNAQVTLMRTTVEECVQIGTFIAEKLSRTTGPLTLLIPEGGLSLIDAPGMPFHDPDADSALFQTIESKLSSAPNRKVIRVPAHINDAAFAAAAVSAFREVLARVTSAKGGTHAGAVLKAAAPSGPEVVAIPVELPPTMPGPRDAVLASLRAALSRGEAIVGAGAGTGISAKFEEAGGADLIIVYNSGRFRMAGHGSLAGLLPFKDANAVMLEMGEEILPVVKNTPVLAGVCGTDPFRRMGPLLAQVKAMGFVGVQNFPTVGLMDGRFRQNLEETGMSYAKEVEMIKMARSLGLLTTPYCFNAEEARQMAGAGADVVVAHLGLTTKGSIGATTAVTLVESVPIVQEIADAAHQVNPEVLVLVHGGPVSMPDDASYVLTRTNGLHGFYGASSVERLPVEEAITAQMRAFKNLKLARSPEQ